MHSSDVLREVDLVLWTIVNVSTLINAIITAKNAVDKRIDKYQRQANRAWSLYFIFMFLANVLNMVWRLYIIELYESTEPAVIIERISLLMLNFGWLVIIGYFDLRMKLLKHPFFFYVILISVVMSFVIQFHSGAVLELIYFIILAIGFSIFPILFIYMGNRAEGEMRKNCYRIAIGAILFGIGLVAQVQNVEPFLPEFVDFFDEVLHIPYFTIPPIMLFISTLLFGFGIWRIYIADINKEEEN